jgi:hypothetical protein
MATQTGTAPDPARTAHGTPTAVAVGVGVGAALLATVVLLVLPSPWLSAPLAVALLALAPTSARLDRRLTLNIALVAGWAPAAMLLPAVLGPRTAAISTLAVAVGATAAVWAVRRPPLLPTTRRRDLAILLAGVLAALIALPLRSPGTPARALAMLSTGIDHAFQFSMYLDRRLSAGLPDFAAGADNSGFASYPKWFHSLLTVLAQVVFGEVGRPEQELVRYAQLEWLVFVAIAVLVTAAVLQSLPRVTTRVFLIPGLVVTWSLVLGVPGSLALLQGHLGFLLAASAPAVIFLLSVPGNRLRAVIWVAIGGLVVLAASWTLLLPFALVTAAYPTYVVWRRQRSHVRWAVVGVAAVTVGAVSVFLLPLVASPALQDLVRDGTVPKVWLPLLIVLLVAPPVLLITLQHRRRDLTLTPHLLVTVAGAGQMAVLGAYMLAKTGEITYYFYKIGLGTLLVLAVVSVHAATVAYDRRPGEVPDHGTRRRFTAVAVCLASLLGLGSALQEFAAPSVVWAAILPTSLADRASSGEAGDVQRVLALARSMDPADAERTTFIATLPSDMRAGHASIWFHALSMSTSARAMTTNDAMYDLAEHRDDTAKAVAIARYALQTPRARVMTSDPRVYRAILDSGAPADPTNVVLSAG